MENRKIASLPFQYDADILNKFRNNKADEVLKMNLYDYREKIDDSQFHFLIGLCMLRMNYFHEAFIAFDKAESLLGQNEFKCILFKAITAFQAQRDEDAQKLMKKLKVSKLNTNERVSLMALKHSYGLDCTSDCNAVISATDIQGTDKEVMMVFALIYADRKEEADSKVAHFSPEMFSDFQTFMMVLGEMYKLGISVATISKAFQSAFKADVLTKLSPDDFMALGKQLLGTGEYFRLDDDMVLYFRHMVRMCGRYDKAHKDEWNKVEVQFLCMEYDRTERNDDQYRMSQIIDKLSKFRTKNKQALLYIVTFGMKHLHPERMIAMGKKIKKLVSMDQSDIKSRKLYHDFLIMAGLLADAEKVAKATVVMRQKQEKDIFSMIYSFHQFYGMKMCIFNSKEHDEHCPLCFGSEYMPIIKTIGFAHSPAEIFVENVEKSRIEVDEKTLEAIVDWQPMNVPSTIVGKYLHSLGAYMSANDYPDVLVPGQTYIFIQMKTETYKRLAKEGYSLSQIDPLWVATNVTRKRKELAIFGDEDKEFSDDAIPVTADDFIVEVIHAISSESDLKETEKQLDALEKKTKN